MQKIDSLKFVFVSAKIYNCFYNQAKNENIFVVEAKKCDYCRVLLGVIIFCFSIFVGRIHRCFIALSFLFFPVF